MVADASDGHPGHAHGLADSGHSQMISTMRHRGRPAHDDLISRTEGIVHRDVDVRESAAYALNQRDKLIWPTKLAAVLKLTVPDAIRRKKVENRLFLAFIPHFP